MSAELALQEAIVARLRSDAPLRAITGLRNPAPAVAEAKVFDSVSASREPPYVSIGDVQGVDDEADCVDGTEVFVTLHAWSTKPGKPEASTMASAVRKALHEADLILDEPYALLEIRHRDSRVFPDADGITTHGVIVFRALIEAET